MGREFAEVSGTLHPIVDVSRHVSHPLSMRERGPRLVREPVSVSTEVGGMCRVRIGLQYKHFRSCEHHLSSLESAEHRARACRVTGIACIAQQADIVGESLDAWTANVRIWQILTDMPLSRCAAG